MTAAFLLSWIAVAVVMSALIAAAAMAAQRLAVRAMPVRMIWAAAMLAMIGVTFTQPLRRAAAIERIEGPTPSALRLTAVESAPPSPLEQMLASLRHAPSRAIDQVIGSASFVAQQLPPAMRVGVLFIWPGATALITVILLGSYRRQRALLRRAVPREMAGAVVHVSADTGPAVIGAATPAIVVPAWLLARTETEQRLVVAHESAHIAAHDPQLLLAGCVCVALMPWNPAAWFALARLRLAIELDCDARVLARGTDTRQYGQLLIEMSAAAPSPAIPLGAPAFSYRASHLERRLRTMTARPTRFLAARRASALLIGSAAVLAACGAELPTATELQGMDVAKAESRIGEVVKLDSATTRYVLNGKIVEARIARGVLADSIATIEVHKTGNKANEIRIVTKGVPTSGTVKEVALANVIGKDAPIVVVRGQPLEGRPVSGMVIRSDSTRGEPLFFIDGKKSTKADLDKLSPNAIESVSVLKGPTAVVKYGADAANGAIEIVLKK